MAQFDCEETKRNVHEYLHNELSESEIKDLTAHLVNCDSCDDEYALEDSVNKLVSRSCSEVPPEELIESIMKRIRNIQDGIVH